MWYRRWLRSGCIARGWNSDRARQYKAMVANDTICDAIAIMPWKKATVSSCPQVIHSIGAGCFLAETTADQWCDVSVRLQTWIKAAISPTPPAAGLSIIMSKNTEQRMYCSANGRVSLVRCPYFCTAVYDLDEPMTLDIPSSTTILIGVKGPAQLSIAEAMLSRCKPANRSWFPPHYTFKVGNHQIPETYDVTA